MNFPSKLVASIAILFGSSLSKPIIKTGDCPTFTRYTAPDADDWSQFPIKPNPASKYPVNTIQNPLKPEESVNCIETAPGLRAELWASEATSGDISYVQHFTFDERGRMWAVEPRAYPNIIRPATNSVTDQKFVGGTDRIVILEDTDGDGVMDSHKVFRDGLNLPQSIEIVNGGVVVTMVPYLVFFPNNNDVAGTPQILWSGMGSNSNYDTHGGTNSLMYGLDNWIYGHTGYNGCNADGVDCGGGRVWRFKHKAFGSPNTEFQAWTTGPANAHGIGQMEDGQIFQSGATGSSHINHSIRKGVAAIDIRNDVANNNNKNLFYPITGDRYLWEGSTAKNASDQFFCGTTAVSGMQFYNSRLFPKKYWSRFAFNCEGSNKLCNQDSLVESTNGSNTGSTWRSVRMPGPARSNLIASTDAWVAPILAKTGPDGAVWVLDWYNYLFLHNPAPPMGVGGAWKNSLREKPRYRIWRVTPTDGSREPVLNLTNATIPQLVSTLSNPNMLWRLHAQRMLIAKGYSVELGTLLETILTTNRTVDSVKNNPPVIHALWTLSGLGRFDLASDSSRWNPILARLLLHPSVGVRRNALMVMPRTPVSAKAISDKCSVNDGHGHVRLQALVALAEIPTKATGLTKMWATYQTVDAPATAAFTASGIESSPTQGCVPTLDPVSIPKVETILQPRGDLRFSPNRQGFTLLPHSQLGSGTLAVYDQAGKVVFQSTYSSSDAKWSQPNANNLPMSMYFYSFHSRDGRTKSGSISLVSRF